MTAGKSPTFSQDFIQQIIVLCFGFCIKERRYNMLISKLEERSPGGLILLPLDRAVLSVAPCFQALIKMHVEVASSYLAA